MEIESVTYFAIAAATGALYYHISGYQDAKKKDPLTEYSYNYMLQTIFVIISVAGGYLVTEMEWSHYNLILAFWGGIGGTVGISKLFKGINKNKKIQEV